MERVRDTHDRPLGNYADLHRFSIEDPAAFWSLLWDFCAVVGGKGDVALADEKMPGARFFPDARLNFAENLLCHAGDQDALVFWGEDKVKRRMSRDELREEVARFAAAVTDWELDRYFEAI